jgi:isopentenyl-diphosphate delta-isomerase
MTVPIGKRKADHIALAATGDVGFRQTTTLLECVRLVHDALPDLDVAALDTSTELLGKRLRAPIVIASMTGGTDEAARINETLAAFAEERGYGFGLGSQRAMHVRKDAGASYEVRKVAPTALVLGNLGVVQARAMKTAEVEALVKAVGADALCIHLNPAMELVQPGGDRDFSGGLETIQRLASELSVPVVVKETGCGISRAVGERVAGAGVRHIDVSGAGGTSWVGVETHRAKEAGDAGAAAIGETFWDWGIPTAVSVAWLAPLDLEIIATGGIASGLDIARAVALGARAAGLARPALKAVVAGGKEALAVLFDRVEAELKTAMLLTGSRTLKDLAKAKRVVVGELSIWLENT